MNKHLLSARLAQVAAFVPVSARLADIGSDHAYLPIALVQSKKIDFAIAGEIAQGPFDSACQQIEKYQLEKQIIARLADGLLAIKNSDRIDTITICGMGGRLICSILTAGKKQANLPAGAQLILQPNNHELEVRRWLCEHGYVINKEAIVEDHGKIYEIIQATYGKKISYTEQEMYFGPLLMREKSEIFQKKWHKKLLSKEKVVTNLANARQVSKKLELEKKYLNWIREVIK
ncbi:MAG TPA: tRNA (adenine(22)-N(1))-methyltransferase TrmK [Tetragenococcus sp.]|nr:tRNA (adenine(22)-N(1))-methyltransferase TrmK [Tetragenococcus sp.]